MHGAYNARVVEYIKGFRNRGRVEECQRKYLNEHPKRNQGFLVGFGEENKIYELVRGESRKDSARIFGTNEFREALEANYLDGVTPTQMTSCLNYYENNPAGQLLITCLKDKPWDTESIVLSQFLKLAIQGNEREKNRIRTLYLHTTLSPCDVCCATIQAFANLMRMEIYVTYTLGYRSWIGGNQRYEYDDIQAANYNIHGLVFTEGERGRASIAIGGDVTNKTFILTFTPE